MRSVSDTLLLAAASASSGAPSDPFFADVQLLLHGEGANGGTVFTDSSSFNKPLVTTGDATTSTTNFKFGTSSILFGGSGNVQMTAASQDPWISMGTGLYTAEWWVYIGSSGISGSFFRNGSAQLTYNSNTIRLYSVDYGSLFLNTGQSLTPAVWTHLAVVQTASTTVVYVNGVGYNVGYKVGTTTLSPINIGSSGFTGYIDELRVTKGVARYTANFTPPTAPFPDF
tara:strand:+ start:16302 stop:16982 length:681 start_codon:yes stop_codon:yes gene_type:complete